MAFQVVETDHPWGEVVVAFGLVAQFHLVGVGEVGDQEVVLVAMGCLAFLVETFQLVGSRVVASFLVGAYL